MITAPALQQALGGLHVVAADLLDGVFRELDLKDPTGTRDALLEVTPQIVTGVSDQASALAADWYDVLRYEELPSGGDRFHTALAEPMPTEFVQQRVRSQAGVL